ncbi:MAG: neutral zinc metallopeptidase [Actinomycetota bacterium]|nr:neutral zinc metallopeptidase [Actinomycetota bacterium]
MPARRRSLLLCTALLLTVAVLSGCSGEIPRFGGQLTRLHPAAVAGLPVTDGPSGPQGGVADASLPVDGGDGGSIDQLAVNAVADLQDYWDERFPADFGVAFTPLRRLVSYDSGVSSQELCGGEVTRLVNAFYCPAGDTIAWDRGALLPDLQETYGPMAIVLVLAHELGHAVQNRLALLSPSAPTIVFEQQADCLTGAFFRHVAEGGSMHFTLSTGNGLGGVLASMFALRDPVGGVLVDPDAHGTAFDRVAAFQFGFADGPRRCAQIDLPEVQERATELGFEDSDDAATGGNLEITEDNVRLIELSLRSAFASTGAPPPAVIFGTVACRGARSTFPVSYCPATNSVSVELDGLAEIGAAPSNGRGGLGDFAAFALVASRYVLVVQRAVGLALDDDLAGLRTACLVGAWAGVLLETPYGNRNPIDDPPLRISSGDLDEAVSELLAGGLIAGDVNGVAAPSRFARVDAFRIGFLEGATPCS